MSHTRSSNPLAALESTLFAMTLTACHADVGNPTLGAASLATPQDSDDARPPDPRSCFMFTAGRSGILGIDADGSVCATVWPEPVDDAVQVGDTIVAWSEARSALPLTISRIDISTGAILAQAPFILPLPDGCDAATVWPEPTFIVPLPQQTSAGLCFELANAPYEDLEDLRLSGFMDLRDLGVQFRFVWGSNPCIFPLPKGSQCSRDEPADDWIIHAEKSYYLADATLWLRKPDGTSEVAWGPIPAPSSEGLRDGELDVVDVGIGSFRAIAVTSTGRYALLAGNVRKGDVGHQDLLMLDRTTGDLFPVPSEASEGWPRPLTIEEIRDLGETRLATLTLVGEDFPRPHPQGDAIAVEELLLRPGRDVLKLPGRLVTPIADP